MAMRQSNQERAAGVARNPGHSLFRGLQSDRFRPLPPCVASPASPQQVADALTPYFARRFQCLGLDFEQRPVELCGGWETYTYSFQFKGHGALPPAFRKPLILRIYSCGDGLDRARYEFAVQRHLGQLEYPIPGHLFLEESCDYFGGPFLISPEVPGETLLRSMLHKPWSVHLLAMRMAATHARLHRLPTRSFPAPGGCFLTRTLEEMTHVVRQYDLGAMRPGLEWLWANRPPSPRRPSVLHLDFHPLNLLDPGPGDLVVIDWTEADVGDPHADLGNTLMSLECMTEGAPGLFDRLFVTTGRWLFVSLYLHGYRNLLPVDDELLTYYRAWATFRRLCHYGHWLGIGPSMQGRKPSAIEHLQPDHFHVLEEYFRKWAKVPVALVPPEQTPLPEPLLL